MAEVIQFPERRFVNVTHDDEGNWNVTYGNHVKSFWKEPHASAYGEYLAEKFGVPVAWHG